MTSAKRILIAYSIASAHISTTIDYLLALKRHSAHDVYYVNVTHGGIPDFDLDEFDVIFHNYCARLCFEDYVSPIYQEALTRFKGLKILTVQDEYDRTNTVREAIKRCGFDIVLAAASGHDFPRIFDYGDTPSTTYVKVLTGYAPEPKQLQEHRALPIKERAITMGYRGRDIGARYGELGFLKFEIGRRMAQECKSRGIAYDIETAEEARIYGSAWFDFIGSCRTMLGSESGSNVFDFDGAIADSLKALQAEGNHAATTYEAFLPKVAHFEDKFSQSEISPRIFECAAMRTPMILFEGRYSDILIPNRHYIPLKKDFSNLDDVFARIQDFRALEQLSQAAYDDLIGSGKYSYRAFGALIDELIKAHPKQTAKPLSAATFNATAVNIEGPSAEAPTPLPLGQVDFQIRQWARIGPLITSDHEDYIALCKDRVAIVERELPDYQLLIKKLKIQRADVLDLLKTCGIGIAEHRQRLALAQSYEPKGSRSLNYEIGLFNESFQQCDPPFNALKDAVDGEIDAFLSRPRLMWPTTWLAYRRLRKLEDRQALRELLGRIPLLARITNKLP